MVFAPRETVAGSSSRPRTSVPGLTIPPADRWVGFPGALLRVSGGEATRFNFDGPQPDPRSNSNVPLAHFVSEAGERIALDVMSGALLEVQPNGSLLEIYSPRSDQIFVLPEILELESLSEEVRRAWRLSPQTTARVAAAALLGMAALAAYQQFSGDASEPIPQGAVNPTQGREGTKLPSAGAEESASTTPPAAELPAAITPETSSAEAKPENTSGGETPVVLVPETSPAPSPEGEATPMTPPVLEDGPGVPAVPEATPPTKEELTPPGSVPAETLVMPPVSTIEETPAAAEVPSSAPVETPTEPAAVAETSTGLSTLRAPESFVNPDEVDRTAVVVSAGQGGLVPEQATGGLFNYSGDSIALVASPEAARLGEIRTNSSPGKLGFSLPPGVRPDQILRMPASGSQIVSGTQEGGPVLGSDIPLNRNSRDPAANSASGPVATGPRPRRRRVVAAA